MEPDEVRDGEEARDRVAVHVLWEAVLLVALGATAALVAARSPSAFSGDQLRGQLVALSASVLLASAAATSLRVAAPNLAVGAIAVGAGALLGWLTVDRGLSLAAAAGVVAGAAVGAGLLLGLLVSGLRAPGWAAGVGAAALLGAGVTALLGARSFVLVDPPDLLRWAWPLFGGAAALSVLAAGAALAPRVRARVGAYRAHADPAAARGASAGAVVVGGLVMSCLLAAVAGAVVTVRLGAVLPGDGSATTATVGAFAAALLGGVSAHGRRGGLLGTALAACTLHLLILWLTLGDAPAWAQPAVLGGALLVGLIVTRLVEALGTPREPDFVPGTLPPAEPPPYEQPTQQQPYDQQQYDPFPRYVERY